MGIIQRIGEMKNIFFEIFSGSLRIVKMRKSSIMDLILIDNGKETEMTPFELPLERIGCEELRSKIVSAAEAAELIMDGMAIGMSGFTAAGDAKAVPKALAKRAENGEKLRVHIYAGASMSAGPEAAMAEAGIVEYRSPFQGNPAIRKLINAGKTKFTDPNLGQLSRMIQIGAMPKDVDIAVIEATALTPEGHIYPTTSVGISPMAVRKAKKVIVELNVSVPMELCGMADIYVYDLPPHTKILPLEKADQRIGTPYIECGIDKISAIVITDEPDSVRKLTEPDDNSYKISRNILKFFEKEIERGALSAQLLPLQSGVGSVANAVLLGLRDSDLSGIGFYTEVMQDGMLDLILDGKADFASTTSMALSPAGMEKFCANIDSLKSKVILRPQEISNGSEPIRRLGVIAMNTALEADIYGNVNSTHVMGTNMMNGIGGSGDFAQNAFLCIFSTASTAKGGEISSIVPMVSHVDHTEHNVMVLVTEQGYADLRGLCPRDRALAIIENCSHPDFRDELRDYFLRACEQAGGHTPHLLDEALSWHSRYMKTGTMKKQ